MGQTSTLKAGAAGKAELLRDKAWARWTALGLLAFAMFCSYVFMDVLSPIKDLLQSDRGWDSTAFGTMQGSETFLNVFVFFLIFAGIILDKMGVRFTAVLSGAVMLVGASINWYALTEGFIGSSLDVWFTNHLNYIPGFDELGVSPFYEGMPASAKLSAIGFMIFGCGVEMAGITVSRGIVKWFKGREMALTSRRGHMYDIFADVRQYGWHGRCQPFGSFRRSTPHDRPDHVYRLFLYGSQARCPVRRGRGER